MVNSKLRLLNKVGIEFSELELFFFVPQEAKEKVAFFLIKEGVSNKDLLIVIAPLSRRQARIWGKEKYAELADRLIAEYKARVIFIWGPGEKEKIEEIVKLMKEQPIISFETSLKEVAALIKASDLFVSNDNGPMHIAVAVKVPTLTIYGPSDERCWCPGGPKHRAIQAKAECLRCGKRVCEEMICMKRLDVSTILQAVKKFSQIISKIKYTDEKLEYPSGS